MKIDYWYKHKKTDIYYIDCFFSDIDCIYRGNIYDKHKKPIGDYSTYDSTKISEYFGCRLPANR